MNLDQQRISPGGNRRTGHGRDFVSASGAVGGVRSHGQMRQLVDNGNRGDIHRVASISLERANTPLAQNDFVVAASEQVFGREQQFFERSRNASLQKHGLANLSEFP